MIYLSTLLISMFITMALIPIFKSVAVQLGNGLDYPNKRKVHSQPIPKVGGIAIALGTLLPVWFLTGRGNFANAIIFGAGVITIFGLIDDVKTLGYKTKFAGQLIAALIVVFFGGVKVCSLGTCLPEDTLLPDFLAIPLTIIAIVGVTNAINLSDGLDGLAAGSSLIIFSCIAYLAYTVAGQVENLFIMLLSTAMVGAIIGFLRYNTYPATVFMGDTGSQLLGFLAVTLTLDLTQNNVAFNSFLPLLLIGFPVLDTLTVMVERIVNGRSPFKADKNHFHHKLIRLGLFHTEAVMVIYVITTLLALAALILRFQSEWLLLAMYLSFSILVIFCFTVVEHNGWRLNREGYFDLEIKGRLKVLKEKDLLIKTSFRAAEYSLPLLLLVCCFLPAAIPGYFSVIYFGLCGLTIITWVFKRSWFPGALRISFYLLVPLILRAGLVDTAAWSTPAILRLYHAAFGLLSLFLVLTLKFTRRQKGFKATPTDFLILVIALVVPILPDPQIKSHHMGFLSTQIIVMYFSFEVLVGELRGQLGRLGIAIIAALLLVAVRGLF